jgi:hypothetical protein
MSAETTGPSHRVFADLAEDLTWFIKCPEIRLLHIATTGTERPVVVHQLALTEGHGHNKSPFFILEDAHTKDEQGWMARAERIAVIHDARRTAMASEGYRLPPSRLWCTGPTRWPPWRGSSSNAWRLRRVSPSSMG